ncbi:SDR family NAD(P)-dependent oxidoreductase, partial [Rhodococcus erythropolis]
MNISGNTIFIAGGTSGIGLALAVGLQNEGNKVIIGGRRSALLQEISDKYSGIGTVVIDVDDPKSIRTAYESVTED